MRRKSTTTEMMKSYIVDSLLLLMEQKDFQDITIGEIVKNAGVNRSTYYRHFKKKEDVISYFFDYLSKTFLAQEHIRSLPLQDFFIQLYRHYYQYKQQLLTIYRNGQSILLLDTLKKYLGHTTTENLSTSVEYHIAFHVGGTFNHFMLWFSRNMTDSPENMAEYTLNVIPANYVPPIEP